MELSSSSLLYYNSSPVNLPCGCCVATPVRLLISNIQNDPIMLQRLLLTLLFINNKPNQPNPNITIESLHCWINWVWVLHCCITSLFMIVQQLHYLIFEYFVKLALELCKVRIKLSSTHSKASNTCFFISSHCHCQPLHCLIHTIRSNYEAYCHSFLTRTIDLHVDSARIFGCCVSSLVILVVSVDLHLWCVRSSEYKQVCHA